MASTAWFSRWFIFNRENHCGIGTRNRNVIGTESPSKRTRNFVEYHAGFQGVVQTTNEVCPGPRLLGPSGECFLTGGAAPHHPNTAPSTLLSTPSTLNPQPSILNPQPSTLNPQPSPLNPQPSTLDPSRYTLHPQPYTLTYTP